MDAANDALASSGRVVVHSAEGPLGSVAPAAGDRLGAALGRVAGAAIRQAGLRRILFAVEGNAGNCGSGTWLTYAGTQSDIAARQANVKAVYAALIAAKTTSTPIRIYGINSGCKVTFFYLG